MSEADGDIVAYEAKSDDLYYQRRKNRHLCKCDQCSERCDQAPIWERDQLYSRQQCCRHMSGQKAKTDGSSFYKPEEVLAQMQHPSTYRKMRSTGYIEESLV